MTDSGHCVHQNGVCCICGQRHGATHKVKPAMKSQRRAERRPLLEAAP
ncbi:MAG TPA: hypothetical protein VNZ52_06275 [Candidatus Thermoplasmatota archaeon]|nr:hypothetical protein [Candidatus Thermoplasmatota archaeon]